VGPIYKIRIGHDNKGLSSGWFLEKLHIQRHAAKSPKQHRKRCKRKTNNLFYLILFNYSYLFIADSPDVEEYFFLVNRWFSKDEDDRQIVRELTPTDERGRPLVTLDGIISVN